MADDIDPGPAFPPRRSVSTSRDARGRGWRSSSVQRNDSAGHAWRNRNDIQPLMANPVPNPWGTGAGCSRQPHSYRGGKAGFGNVNNRFDNHAISGTEYSKKKRDQHYNHRRGDSNKNRDFDQNMKTDTPHNNPRRYFNDNRNYTREKRIGFKRLEEIARSENQDALAKLMESKEAFIDLIQSPIERFDVFVLIIECMAKVCQSSFHELKLSLLRDTCYSNFIVSLKSYMMDLPYPKAKAANNLYWNDPDRFWKNLITFFESVVNTSPTLALDKCRSLIEATSIASLDGLKERHTFVLPEEYETKLKELRVKMNNFEKMRETSHTSRKQFILEEGSPPEDFRELSVMPSREDLLQMKPFVRPNIIDGAYKDVDHYLDVQFRLLREDCFGPLREGLGQYMRDPKMKRYDHIRVFHNVKFVKPYASQMKIGSFVQIDTSSDKNFKRINWSNSKRFIFGSLVLFTKDNCKSFLVGTILDREEKYLMQGLIPVSLMGTEFNEHLYNDDASYTLIESEVYFEPYYHVLRALQDQGFPDHIVMKQYIVDVNPEPKHPSYLKPDTEFILKENRASPIFIDENGLLLSSDESDSDAECEEVELVELSTLLKDKKRIKTKFTVLQEETWPDENTLEFNESQLHAYKHALTHEFAVIQGPPGTGKTYLGIKVAQTLFQNLKKDVKGCLMLVICYTNHALDQFLEALLKITGSIARIGGQSRNPAIDPINLKKLRRNKNTHCNAETVYVSQKLMLKSVVSEFQKALVELDVLLNGVAKNKMLSDTRELLLLCHYSNVSSNKALYQWLFQYWREYHVDVNALFAEEKQTKNAYADYEKEARKRTGVHIDDQESNEAEQMTYRASISSFSLEETDLKIKQLITKYKESPDPMQQRNYLDEIEYLSSCKELFNDMSQYRSRRINARITDQTNFYQFSTIDRWTLYFTWIHDKVMEKKDEIGVLQARVNAANTAYEEASMLFDMQVLKDKKVVGMTTSGAAKMRKLLQTLAPPIVIVEEAAEVLEQHIITSLTKDCKHLILIGDHQQLRPSASHMKLAKHYNIEVSLFERMVANGIHSRRLGVQHRMRPDIAALICPHIYPELQNHPTVYDFPDVMGMTKNLFFFTHDHREQEVVENMSRTNFDEADLVLALANYLMQQGYTADDVTILAAYKGQMFYMRKESIKYTHLLGVKITVVDNYQGEESRIILLSLVRNNEENNIGFLGTANRICVALSRAKEGFYIFGNIENLKANSRLWQDIATTLESGDSLGTSLTLKCQNHVNNLTSVNKVADFEEVPEGGCKALCEFSLPGCGHKCQLFCHGYDRGHITNYTRCPKKCERILCDLGHVCPLKCPDACQPCKVKVTKKLPCGHEMAIYCHLEPDDDRVKCFTMVDVMLPDCGHEVQKMCYAKIKDVRCTVKCEYRVDKCGHTCLRKCHVNDDPDHEKYLCNKLCAKAKRGCLAGLDGDRGEHQCRKMCHETCDQCCVEVEKRRSTCQHKDKVMCSINVDEKPCLKKCAKKLSCDHFCKKKCWEPCGDCTDMVTKEIQDCKHKVKMLCKQPPVRSQCTQKCTRSMICGHKCKGKCKDVCDPSLCTEPTTRMVASPCGHQIPVPCNQAKLPTESIDVASLAAACGAACGAALSCGHPCGAACGPCRAGRVRAVPRRPRAGRAAPAACTRPARRPATRSTSASTSQCEEPCNQICPPCKKPCEVRCKHSRCRKLCGAPCTPCKEQCSRGCPHSGLCSRRCGEACSAAACGSPCARRQRCGHACRGLCGEPCARRQRCGHACRGLCGEPCARRQRCGHACRGLCGEPCARRQRCGHACRGLCGEPCARRQRCGHACRGLCGEPCPSLCKDCDPEHFPTDFLGDDYDDDAKFILLQDCGHVMELENMDNLMFGDRETVEIRKCPFCRKPIVNTGRYKDLVNKIFKEEINPIKRKIYGTEKQITAKREELHQKLQQFQEKYLNVVTRDQYIKQVYLNLQSISKTTKKVSKLHLEMELICLNILDMIAECYKKYMDSKLTELNSEITDQTKMLCGVFTFKINAGAMLKVSEQQQKDMSFEIKRMNSIVQFAKLIEHGSYGAVKNTPAVKKEFDAAHAAVFTWSVFDEEKAIASLKNLQEAMKVSGSIVTKQERDMVVRAMGMKAGAWYKCPNNHFYCIGDCGGANQLSKCPECGAAIGGTSHRLTAGNQHAGELDGSRAPAWPQHVNDMANYNFN